MKKTFEKATFLTIRELFPGYIKNRIKNTRFSIENSSSFLSCEWGNSKYNSFEFSCSRFPCRENKKIVYLALAFLTKSNTEKKTQKVKKN